MTIHREDHDRIAILRLEHGKVQAMDLELCRAIRDAFTTVPREPGVDALVLTGTGSSFSAGVDLFRITREGNAYVDAFLPALDAMIEAVFACDKPVVAAINGHAIAGGHVLAACCDHRLMAEGKGRIGVPELLVGVAFPWLALEVVRLALPVGQFGKLVYLGETPVAADACARGIVDELAPPEELVPRAVGHARRMATSPLPFTLAKQQQRAATLLAWPQHAAHDARVRAVWRDPATLGRIERYLEATIGKK